MAVEIGDEEEALNGDDLWSRGYRRVVTVCQRPVPIDKRHPAIRYFFVPLRDEPNFRMDFSMHRASGILREHCDGKTLLHCAAGISRSPSVWIAHQLLTDRTASVQEEYSRLRHIRPCVNLNLGFFYQLLYLESFPFQLRTVRRVYFSILAFADQCGPFIHIR